MKNNVFFGGNLWGVAQKLDRLSKLGVSVIYLNPIFEAASNHKYDIGDYMKIDGGFGGEAAFAELGIKIRWEGEGVNEKGYDEKTGKLLVDVNPEFYRPAEVEFLWGDSTKAEKELGWKRKVDFKGLVSMMMDSDLKEIAGMSCEEYKAQNA